MEVTRYATAPLKSYFANSRIQYAWLGTSASRDAINPTSWVEKSDLESWSTPPSGNWVKNDKQSGLLKRGKSCHQTVLVTPCHCRVWDGKKASIQYPSEIKTDKKLRILNITFRSQKRRKKTDMEENQMIRTSRLFGIEECYRVMHSMLRLMYLHHSRPIMFVKQAFA